jgi:hypothetical protein
MRETEMCATFWLVNLKERLRYRDIGKTIILTYEDLIKLIQDRV